MQAGQNQQSIPPHAGSIQWDSVPLLRGCATLVAIKIGSLIVGGFGVYLIVLGLYIALARPLIYWSRTRPWIIHLMKMPVPATLPANPSIFWRTTINLVHLMISVVFIGIGVSVIWMGVKLLLERGFLQQNLIYLLLIIR